MNINPLGCPEKLKEAMIKAVERVEEYPDIRYERLKNAIAGKYSTDVENVLVGNGASELFMAVLEAVRPGKVLLTAPSFSGYEYAANAVGAEVKRYFLKDKLNFRLDEDFSESITDDVDCVILAIPNNPTGDIADTGLIEKIADTGKLLILDECFISLTEKSENSFIFRLRNYNNVIVVRSFTKSFAIPGVRLGYAVCGDEVLARRIGGCLPEWNLSVLAEEAGLEALADEGFLKDSRKIIAAEREFLSFELSELGFRVIPSEADYILFYEKSNTGLKDKLIEKKILIRDCSDYYGLENGWYRIAVKKHEDNIELIKRLKEIRYGT
ncbi:MAG: aminotransferase class I/II-fold pyridoxal phosphate-dependent enzyme [Lachnospiraceae bacterium]|nr:aminotransferase class I/II-fold pyridoxal phosphate-dependent enzyme [Lachnospiraceae bacterium]